MSEGEFRGLVRWGVQHGAARVAFRVAARRGDPLARLIMDPALRADPFPLYDRLRATPVVPGKVAALTARHDLVSAYLRDPKFLVGFPVETLPGAAQKVLNWAEGGGRASAFDRPSMVVTNGEEHALYRRAAMKAFTARAVAGLESHVEAIAEQLLEEMAARHADGSAADVVAEFAEILPVLVIAEILGVPRGMRPIFRDWATAIVAAADVGVSWAAARRSERAMAALSDWMTGHLRQLRSAPEDNLFSRMVAAADEEAGGPRRFSEQGLVANGMLLLLAGFETTVNLVGNATSILLTHRAQLGRLQADPQGWPNAVEEVLRYAGPVRDLFRYLAEPTVLEGVPIKRGQYVVLMVGAANRDPAVFPQPHVFDVERVNARDNISFGAGGHFCVGAALARLEGAVALRMLFERFPDLAQAGPAVPRGTRLIHGLAGLPVRLGGARQTVGPAT